MEKSVSSIQVFKCQKSRLDSVDFAQLGFGNIFSDHMFVADFYDEKWQDLRIIPYGDFKISPSNVALHYGQSIFEGLKAHRSSDGDVVLFRHEANAQRFSKSAIRMAMRPVDTKIFVEAIEQLVNLDRDWIPSQGGSSLYIRPLLFATDAGIGVRASSTYRFMVITSPVGKYYNKPVKVKVETHFSRACNGGVGFAKTAGNYAASLHPASQAINEGFDQLIWTDSKHHEYVEESGTMNLMFVIDGILVTPPTSDSILKGITRDSAITLAKSWGIDVEERPVKISEMIEAIKTHRLTEAFGIGTAATITQIQTIHFEGNNYLLPDIATRKVSNRLHETLAALQHGATEDKWGWTHKF